jgi:hypothetical protein
MYTRVQRFLKLQIVHAFWDRERHPGMKVVIMFFLIFIQPLYCGFHIFVPKKYKKGSKIFVCFKIL